MSSIFYSYTDDPVEITTGSELYKVPRGKESTVVINAVNTDSSNSDNIRIAVKDYDQIVELSDNSTVDDEFNVNGDIFSNYTITTSSGDLGSIISGTTITLSGGSTAKVKNTYEDFPIETRTVTSQKFDRIFVDSMSNFAIGDILTQGAVVANVVYLKSATNEVYVQYTQGGPFLADYDSVGEIQTFTAGVGTTLVGEADQTYTSVSGTASASGSGATFNVTRDSNGDISDVTIVESGLGYVPTETITIDGASIGGVSVTDDLVITVDTIDQSVDGTVTSNNSGSAVITTVNQNLDGLFFGSDFAEGFTVDIGRIYKFVVEDIDIINFNIFSDISYSTPYTYAVSRYKNPGTSGAYLIFQVTPETSNTVYFGAGAYPYNDTSLNKGTNLISGNERTLVLYDVSGSISTLETFTYNATQYTISSVNVGSYGRINRYIHSLNEVKVFLDYGSFVDGSLVVSDTNMYYVVNNVYNLKLEDHIEYDKSLSANTSFQRPAIVLQSEGSIVVYSENQTSVFNVYGFEE
jgi:hypothetical protein